MQNGRKRRRTPLLSIVLPTNMITDDSEADSGAIKRGGAGVRQSMRCNSCSSGGSSGATAGLHETLEEERPSKRQAPSVLHDAELSVKT